MRQTKCLILATCLTLVLSHLPLSGQSQATVDSLTGIWASETKFIPVSKGELTVTRRGQTWLATLSGVEARFRLTGARVSFHFPGNLGQFRGTLTDQGSAIEGFWLQPPAATETQP